MEDILSNHDVGKVPHSVYYIKNVQHGGKQWSNYFEKKVKLFQKSFVFFESNLLLNLFKEYIGDEIAKILETIETHKE